MTRPHASARSPSAGCALVLALDTLIEGVHFPHGTCAADVAHKALAVNLSDLAAMGAVPIAASYALCTAPGDVWRDELVGHLASCAVDFALELDVGTSVHGTTRSISVEALGEVPSAVALTRAGASPGDVIFVTGTLGDAGLALGAMQGAYTLSHAAAAHANIRLARPTPRLSAGLALRGVASAAIDVSDGLLQDLSHILAASDVGASVDASRLPLSTALAQSLTHEDARRLALSFGDDYEICFTVPPDRLHALPPTHVAGVAISPIGHIEGAPGLRLHAKGAPLAVPDGYQHFA